MTPEKSSGNATLADGAGLTLSRAGAGLVVSAAGCCAIRAKGKSKAIDAEISFVRAVPSLITYHSVKGRGEVFAHETLLCVSRLLTSKVKVVSLARHGGDR